MTIPPDIPKNLGRVIVRLTLPDLTSEEDLVGGYITSSVTSGYGLGRKKEWIPYVGGLLESKGFSKGKASRIIDSLVNKGYLSYWEGYLGITQLSEEKWG